MTRDTIDRQAAIDEVKQFYRKHDNDLLELLVYKLEQLPSEQPKTAKWIKIGYRWIKCSNCCWENIDVRLEHTDYCPGCGARMEEQDEWFW